MGGLQPTCTQQSGREDDSVKRDVVLAHELNQLHIIGVLPPRLPVANIIGSDTDVADGSVKPDIEDLVLIAGAGNRCAPLQVTGDASDLESIPHP